MNGGRGAGGRGAGGRGARDRDAGGAGHGGYDVRGRGGRGTGDRGTGRRQPGPQPGWDDSGSPPGQTGPAGRPGQPGGQPAQRPGYGADYGQPPDPDYGQPTGRGQGYGPSNGRPDRRARAGRPDGGASRRRPAGGAQPGFGEPQQPRRGAPQPPRGNGPQPGLRGSGGAQPAYPEQPHTPRAQSPHAQYGSGPQPAQPGGAQQSWQGQQPDNRGYDQRGAIPRRPADGYPSDGYPSDGYPAGGYPAEGYAAGGYPPDGYPAEGYPARGDAARFGQDGSDRWDEGDAPFLPGFGGREEFEAGGRRGSRYPDPADDYGSDYGSDYGDAGRDPRDRRDPSRRDPRDRRDGRDRDDLDGRRPRRGPVRRLAPWIALLVIVVPLIVGVIYVYNLYQGKVHPPDYAGPGAGTVTVQVKSGDTATSLAPRLVSLGVVASSRAFVLAAEHSTSTKSLEAGFYKMNHRMQASLAYAALLNPKNRVQLTLTFPEGLRLSQIVALLAAHSGIPAGDYQQVLRDPAQLGLPGYAKGKPEGYLFPATYQVQPNDTALIVLKTMVQRFNQEATALGLTSAAARVHLTPAQAIVVASLVQAEGGRLQDYPKIAEVVYNRLAKGMQLKFDSTVFYGLGKYGTAATFAEINTPGPYNTYLNKGLPPGPIDSPGAAAIKAALHPATGNLLYFFGFKNGVTEFSPNPIAH